MLLEHFEGLLQSTAEVDVQITMLLRLVYLFNTYFYIRSYLHENNRNFPSFFRSSVQMYLLLFGKYCLGTNVVTFLK